MLTIFLDDCRLYCLRQGLLFHLELAGLVRPAGQEAPGSSSGLHLPSAENIDGYNCAWLLCGCSGSNKSSGLHGKYFTNRGISTALTLIGFANILKKKKKRL